MRIVRPQRLGARQERPAGSAARSGHCSCVRFRSPFGAVYTAETGSSRQSPTTPPGPSRSSLNPDRHLRS
ncbi:hypothetical protein CURTO8I2_280125 [Curtobacterium sp. 8I-2]|nr:hypothetical protein CURTO8I2_280125 [Curtobacterium sp. 8I-2]